MTKAKILYVEDDPSLSYITKENLELANFQVDGFGNGADGYNAFKTGSYDICILDVMLPLMDGFELAKKIREINKEVPIIFLTAKSAKEDRITGLKTGADDYMTKPYSIEELILKIEVFLKRNKISNTQLQNDKPFNIGIFEFDYHQHTLNGDGKNVKLTQKEAELIHLFVKNKNAVIKREIILNTIWGSNDYFMGRSLDVFITRLRKYFKADKTITVVNVHGVGFKLVCE